MGNRAAKSKHRPICWAPLRDGRVVVVLSGWPNGTAEILDNGTSTTVSAKKAAALLAADYPPPVDLSTVPPFAAGEISI